MMDEDGKKRQEIADTLGKEFPGLFPILRSDERSVNHTLIVENRYGRKMEITDLDNWREQIKRSGITQ